MDEVAFAAAYAALRERFEVEHGDPRRQLVAYLSGQPAADVGAVIEDMVGPPAGVVVVLWPGDERAVRMLAADLVASLAKLWRPGRDDLLVADPDRRWAVLLDHQAGLWRFVD
jgi:hypothetical protein